MCCLRSGIPSHCSRDHNHSPKKSNSSTFQVSKLYYSSKFEKFTSIFPQNSKRLGNTGFEVVNDTYIDGSSPVNPYSLLKQQLKNVDEINYLLTLKKAQLLPINRQVQNDGLCCGTTAYIIDTNEQLTICQQILKIFLFCNVVKKFGAFIVYQLQFGRLLPL